MKFHRQSLKSPTLSGGHGGASALAIFPMGVGKMINQALNIHVPTFVWFGVFGVNRSDCEHHGDCPKRAYTQRGKPINTPASYKAKSSGRGGQSMRVSNQKLAKLPIDSLMKTEPFRET